MKRKWRLVGGAVILLAVTGGIRAWRPAASRAQNTLITHSDSRPHVRPQSIGWVFGRLVGVPGADKPMMNGSGLSNKPIQIRRAASVQR